MEFVQVTSIWPYFLTSAAFLVIASLLSSTQKFYRDLLDVDLTSNRFKSIDGLRGFLALAVYFHHAIISYFYYKTGQWELPPSKFYLLLGQFGVALFFMITAFLFWLKGSNAKSHLSAQQFLWARLMRLSPMYLISVSLVIAISFFETDFKLQEPILRIGKELLTWSSFGFLIPMDINQFSETTIINSVYWSLAYEWCFYLILPLILIFSRGMAFILLITIVSLLIFCFSVRQVEWNFLCGILAAEIVKNDRIKYHIWYKWPVSLIILLSFCVFFTEFPSGYGGWQSITLLIAFTCIAKGNSVFGILTCRAARFLGSISYSIYLIHCIILFVFLKTLNNVQPIVLLTPVEYWTVVATCGALVIFVCSFSYRFIEHTSMRFSLPKWLDTRTEKLIFVQPVITDVHESSKVK